MTSTQSDSEFRRLRQAHEDPSKRRVCDRCDGTQVSQIGRTLAPTHVMQTCPRCDGRGWLPDA